MTDESRKFFFDHAVAQMPREACAVVAIVKGKEKLFICRNKSSVIDQFLLDPEDFKAASQLGEIVAIVHSHVLQPAFPSEADKVACEATNLEWHICSVPTGSWYSFKPSGYKAPLVGRQWAHGILDCYSLVRDYYRETLNVELIDFDREDSWWDKGFELFCDRNCTKAGFIKVQPSELQKHDALIMQVKSKVPNHAGVYLGDDMFLHQLSRRLSSRDVYAGYFQKHTVKVLRYVG